jgi:hypothetical protein
MNRLHRAALLIPLLAGSCASARTSTWSDRELRVAEDTPVQFVTEDGTQPEQACRSPLLDPRDQTRIRLLRSGTVGGASIGDYQVPEGRYGVGRAELLRIDCDSGQPLGIVLN